MAAKIEGLEYASVVLSGMGGSTSWVQWSCHLYFFQRKCEFSLLWQCVMCSTWQRSPLWGAAGWLHESSLSLLLSDTAGNARPYFACVHQLQMAFGFGHYLVSSWYTGVNRGFVPTHRSAKLWGFFSFSTVFPCHSYIAHHTQCSICRLYLGVCEKPRGNSSLAQLCGAADASGCRIPVIASCHYKEEKKKAWRKESSFTSCLLGCPKQLQSCCGALTRHCPSCTPCTGWWDPVPYDGGEGTPVLSGAVFHLCHFLSLWLLPPAPSKLIPVLVWKWLL